MNDKLHPMLLAVTIAGNPSTDSVIQALWALINLSGYPTSCTCAEHSCSVEKQLMALIFFGNDG